MPKSLTAHPDLNHSFLRPVVFDIARQVLKWTGQNPEIPILFPGESEVAYQPNSTIEEEKRNIRLPSDLKFFIEVDEEYDTEKLLAIATLQDENLPYFHDKKINIRLCPIYSPAIIKLNFKLREVDSNRIRRWRDDMRMRLSQGRDQRQHVISYYYLVPTEYQSMLKHFYHLREANAGYGDSYEQWLFGNSINAVTEMVTMGGNQPQLVVTETASRVLGNFDFEVPDKPQKENDTSAHSIAFSYIIYCDIPLGTAAHYPPLIHNQHIAMKYIPKREDFTPEFVSSRGSVSTVAMRYFEKDVGIRPNYETGYRLPYYNDYRVRPEPDRCIRVLSALVTVSYDDDGNILPFLNLKELYGEVYNDAWIRLLTNQHQHLNRFCESVVYIALSENNEMLHSSRYEVTQDLDVVATVAPDSRKLYHVAMYLLRDPSMITHPGNFTDEQDVDTYIRVVSPNIRDSKNIPRPPSGGKYTVPQIRTVFDIVRKNTNNYTQIILNDNAQVAQHNVGRATIEIGRKER